MSKGDWLIGIMLVGTFIFLCSLSVKAQDIIMTHGKGFKLPFESADAILDCECRKIAHWNEGGVTLNITIGRDISCQCWGELKHELVEEPS